MVRTRIDEIEPGALAGDSGCKIIQDLIETEVRLCCDLYVSSGKEAHLWQAWRSARATGEVSPSCMAILTPHFDRLAKQPRNTTRADQLTRRNYLLFDYYHEIRKREEKKPGCAKSLKEARERTARTFHTTEGAVKQTVMEYEGRGERGKNKRNNKNR